MWAQKSNQSPTAWARLKLLVAAGAGLVGYAYANSYAVASVGEHLQMTAKVVNSITALRALAKTGNPCAFVTGYYSAFDGGGGQYVYDSADTTTADNDGTVIVASDGGRWKLCYTASVSTKQFGVKADGAAGTDAAQTQKAFSSGVGEVRIADGVSVMEADVELSDNLIVRFSKGATWKASANNRKFIKSVTHAYGSQVHGGIFDGNGKTNVKAFDLTNFRLSAVLENNYFTGVAYGYVMRSGCFGAKIVNPSCFNCPSPALVIENCATLVIDNPAFDNEVGNGGSGLGKGIAILASGIANEGVIVRGGFVQGYERGVDDAGIGTRLEGTYFEACTEADVYGNAARGGEYGKTQHFAAVGAAGYKLRNCDAVTITNPTMASGARTALYDVDSSNTNCQHLTTDSNASWNSPIGDLTYLGRMVPQTEGSFTPVIVGSTTAGAGTYTTQAGKWSKTGKVVQFSLEVTTTAHTGTGNFQVTGLPAALAPASYSPGRLFQVIVTNAAVAGPALFAQFSGAGTAMTLIQVDAAGTAALVAIDPAVTILISGTYTQ